MSSSSTGSLPVVPATPPCGGPPSSSNYPVRYADGEVMMTETDLAGSAFGLSWGHTRSYGNQLSSNEGGFNGNSWLVSEAEYLVAMGGTIAAMRGVGDTVWFGSDGTTWRPQLGWHLGLRQDSAAPEYQMVSEGSGLAKVFYDNSASVPWYLRGTLKRVVSGGGRVADISRDGQGRITQWVVTDGTVLNALKFTYDYFTLGAGAGCLAAVTQVSTKAGSEVPVRRARYSYYGQAEAFGSYRDLKKVLIEQWDGAAWQPLSTRSYRYYKSGDALGFAHGLRFVAGPEAWARMSADGIDPETAPDVQLAGYADKYFEYDALRRVTRERVSGGLLTFTFSYTSSAFADDYNAWKTKTVHTRPDGTQETVYSNFKLLTMLRVLSQGVAPSLAQWFEYNLFNNDGQVVLAATSAAVAGVNESTPGLVTLQNDVGLVRISSYYAATISGQVRGYLAFTAVQRGTGGVSGVIQQSAYSYTAQTVGANSVFQLATETVFNSEAGGGSNPVVTNYTPSWQPGTLQLGSNKTTLPVVPTTQNGDEQTYTRNEIYDLDGYNTWSRNELGIITRRVYDSTGGTLKQLIEDVDTNTATGVPIGWMTPAGAGKNLVSDYSYDLLGRQTQILGPTHTIDLQGVAVTMRQAAFTVYRDDLDQEWTAQGYATGSAPTYGYTTLNPVSIIRKDKEGRVIDQIQAARSGTGRLSAAESFPQSAWLRWTSTAYDNQSRRLWERVYFQIPQTGGDAGLNGTHYNQTDFGYDAMDRRNRVRSGGGTITRMVFDARDEVVETWVGTDDTGATDSDPSGGGAVGNNMVKVAARQYDHGAFGGNGLLTQETQYASASDSRVTTYNYDWRDRQIGNGGELGFYQTSVYDNPGRLTASERRVGNAAGSLLAKNESFPDPLGRVYRDKVYGVNASGGLTGQALANNTWYDGAGHAIKRQSAGSQVWTKTQYDSLGRAFATFLCQPQNGMDDGDTNVVTADIVIEQNENVFDRASNLIEARGLLRFHNATGPGALNGPSGSQPQARIYYRCIWPDALGRPVADADYGTAGGAPVSRPDVAPSSSDIVLVSRTTYDVAGQAAVQTDPMGIETRRAFDGLGRPTKQIENYVTGLPSAASDRTTQYGYDNDGHLALLTLQNSETGAQVTRWEYGTTRPGSGVASSQLLRAKVYPDSADAGNPLSVHCEGDCDRVEYTYNQLGQPMTSRDANGTVHTYDYDKRGRRVQDGVPTIGPGVNDAVRRIGTGYDTLERVALVTSYDNATVGSGAVVNQVAFDYDDFGQLKTDRQAHAGAVVAGTPAVAYAHANGSANTARLTSITYPSLRQIELSYGAAGSIDDVLSRVAGIKDVGGAGQVADYLFLGSNTAITSTYNQPAVALTYVKQGSEPNGEAGDQYAGLDRFGRDIDHRWIATGSITDLERIQYGYNRGGLRQWRREAVAAAAGKALDDYYQYDGLAQVTERAQGMLNGGRTGINGTAAQQEDWIYDPAGNWDGYQRSLNGSLAIDQSRTHTKANAIRTFGASSIAVAYDRAGNMLRVPRDEAGTAFYTLNWDAWNRLVRLQSPATSGLSSGSTSGYSTALDIAYAYDGLTRRTTKAVALGPNPGTIHYYYNADWKCVEERRGGSATADRQYVFGSRGRNDLVFRDRATNSSPERLYALCDAMGSKVAIINATGTIQERYLYTTFGQTQVLDPSFNPRAETLFDWETRFHGEVRDSDSGYYNYGFRYYSPSLGRWLNRDPIGEDGGVNAMAFVCNSPCNFVDAIGLEWLPARNMGDDFYWAYGAFGAAQANGGQGIQKATIIPPQYIQSDCGCWCVKEGTGIARVQWYYWTVKPGAPPQLANATIMTAGTATFASWHETTEISLLERLYNHTLKIAEQRAQENVCSEAHCTGKNKQDLDNYIKWNEAAKAYNAETKPPTDFDKVFGLTIKTATDGKQYFYREHPEVPYNEAAFDKWYAPNIYGK